LAESILLSALRDWVRNLGLASYNKVSLRTDPRLPEFGQFHWDLVGPSYVYPLATAAGGKVGPGFFVTETLLDRELSIADFSYFTRKCQILRAGARTRPFMAMLLADRFQRDALVLGRNQGLVMATRANLFGERVARDDL